MRIDSRAWIEIDLTAIRSNIQSISASIGGISTMAVVKADAYGHGLVPVAEAAISAGCTWLGVATVSEGAILRDSGITAPVALLSAPAPADAPDIVRNSLTSLVGDVAMLSALNACKTAGAPPVPVHLDIDTGIGRSGVLPGNAVSLWQHAQSLGIDVEGVSTHFADADNADDAHTRIQNCQFEEVCDALQRAGARFKWIHLENSAAISSTASTAPPTVPGSPALPARRLKPNLIRPGLLIYGIAPLQQCTSIIEVKPALALKARIAAVRELPKGHAISYGVLHRLTRSSLIATVLIGYGDGYPRGLSNRWCMLVNGRRAPILGAVCMDQTVIDVTDIPDVSAGDEVVCIGEQHGQTTSVEQIAQITSATQHEITIALTNRLGRIYVDR